jgi:hypothetical protein
MHVRAGPDEFDKAYFEGRRLLEAVESSLMMLAVFILIVLVTALINARARSRGRLASTVEGPSLPGSEKPRSPSRRWASPSTTTR